MKKNEEEEEEVPECLKPEKDIINRAMVVKRQHVRVTTARLLV